MPCKSETTPLHQKIEVFVIIFTGMGIEGTNNLKIIHKIYNQNVKIMRIHSLLNKIINLQIYFEILPEVKDITPDYKHMDKFLSFLCEN